MAKPKVFERGKRYELKKSIAVGEEPKEGENDNQRYYDFVEPAQSAVGKERGACWPFTQPGVHGITDNVFAGTFGAELKALQIVSIADCE